MRSITGSFWRFLICATAVAITGSVAQASPTTKLPAGLEMSLDGSTFSQGEPILIHYKITNGGDQDMYPDTRDGRNQCLEENYKGWFSLMLKDAAGKTAPAVSFFPPLSEGATGTGPRIPAGTSYASTLILNQWVTADHPGIYLLSVHVRLPCTLGSGTSISWFPLTKDFSFPLIITPTASNRLRFKASALRTAWIADADPSQGALKLKSLFALPEQTALPEWQALVADESLTGSTREMVAKEASQINSLGAVDLMAQLCWGPHPPDQKQTSVTEMLCLSGMWIHGNAAMKKHIEKLAAEHGEQMPFKPLVRLD